MKKFKDIAQLNHRDRDAFKYVFDTCYKSICLFIRKYIPDPDLSEDIAQDVFVSIWEKKLEFANMKALKAYLYQTAKNMSINILEHEKVKKEYQNKTIHVHKKEDSFSTNYIRTENQHLLLKALDNLPPRAYEIIHLQLEGLRNNEIAEKLEISVYTVKNHKAVAYKFLKKKLKDIVLLSGGITYFLSKIIFF
jgi:RNA polymerase sigma-70 factor (family 1)